MRSLLRVLASHRNRLIDDEGALLEHIRIEVKPRPVRISFFPKSDIITVRWRARISEIQSKTRCVKPIPLDHAEKHRELLEWMAQQDVAEVRAVDVQLRKEGFESEG